MSPTLIEIARLRGEILKALTTADAAARNRDDEIKKQRRPARLSNDPEEDYADTLLVLKARARMLIEHGFSKKQLEPLL